jgi:glycosyltransferase involved in cell wall biosynthesis
MENKKLKILFRGWIGVPHSYAIVNCFQLVNLYKRYKDVLDIYIEEMPYFQQHWNNAKKMVYTREYNEIISSLREWRGQKVDLVYSITYPYNMTSVNLKTVNGNEVPKCVFYTSEFAALDVNYFTFDNAKKITDDEYIKDYIKQNQRLYMTSPSVWSYMGMKKYGLEDERNRIITHGVDPDIFRLYEDVSIRQKIRSFYKISDSDILLMNIGAMTQNKGILLILEALNHVVNRLGKSNYKMMLKGMGDLYQTKTFLELYFDEMIKKGVIMRNEMVNLLENHIIFTDKTLSYEKINELYNAADMYVSPYLAEGFNMTTLEALSAGLPVLVPMTGSTKEYIEDIKNGGGSNFITYVKSIEIQVTMHGFKQNHISVEDLINTLVIKEEYINSMKTDRYKYNEVKDKYIRENYSWWKVSEMLYNYFSEIVEKCN